MQHIETAITPEAFLSLNNNNEDTKPDMAALVNHPSHAGAAGSSPSDNGSFPGTGSARGLKVRVKQQPDVEDSGSDRSSPAAGPSGSRLGSGNNGAAGSAGGSGNEPIGSSTDNSYLSSDETAQFEADKRLIYKHPLFPLLALLFEKCELATQSNECPTTESFNLDIQAFVQHQDREGKPFFTDNQEVNDLMVKSIQVLRIHLLELEKVQELCKDFCNRYITCLKGKMQSENLLRSDYGGYDSDDSSGRASVGAMAAAGLPHHPHQAPPPGMMHPHHPAAAALMGAAGAGPGGPAGPYYHHPAAMHHNVSFETFHTVGTVLNSHEEEEGVHERQHQQVYHLCQNTSNSQCYSHYNQCWNIYQQYYRHHEGYHHNQNIAESTASEDVISMESSSQETEAAKDHYSKRGILPKRATDVMKSWLFQHIVHPYPTEDEKRNLADLTKLSLLQVNNWFINARRRILQPMMESSEGVGNYKGKEKKKRRRRRTSLRSAPAKRFWPESLHRLKEDLIDPKVSSPIQDDDVTISLYVL